MLKSMVVLFTVEKEMSVGTGDWGLGIGIRISLLRVSISIVPFRPNSLMLNIDAEIYNLQ